MRGGEPGVSAAVATAASRAAFAQLAVVRRTTRTVNPILIGYFPKRTVKPPAWLEAAGVTEVCSVSTCVSDGPEGWIDQWRHNDMWVYDTPESAWSVRVPGLRAI